MVCYQMSQGKNKTTVIFCTLQNTVKRPGCRTSKESSSSVLPLCLHGPLFWETLHSRHNRLAWDRPVQDTDRHPHFCLTCMVGGRDAEATLKSSFPKGYLIFRCLYTNSVPISTCLVHRYIFTADFDSCLPEESSVSFLMLTVLLRVVLYVLVLLLF